jgi:hypothetical protein
LPEPSTIKAVLEILLKPFSAIANPIAERIGNKLKRKPKLYFNIHPITRIWCLAWQGTGEDAKAMMQIRFDADITNDGDDAILILNGYVEGTKASLPLMSKIQIPPITTFTDQMVTVFSAPVLGKRGKDFTGRIIFEDQLKRKHPTEQTTFKWVGPIETPGFPSKP